MHITQRDGQQSLNTELVWYDGTEELLPGYSVCYDMTASLTEGSDGWNEKVRGRVVAKPATANLRWYAGVVIDPPRKNGDATGTFKGWCTIAKLRNGTFLKALVNADTTLPTDASAYYLRVANANFALVAEATSTTATHNTIAVAAEVIDGSPTAANGLVMGVL